MIVHRPFIDEMHTKNPCNRFRSRAHGRGARAMIHACVHDEILMNLYR
jgi:hypothetical protein